MLVKKNADGSSDVFVASIKTGIRSPAWTSSARKNGMPLAQARRADGRVTFRR